MAVELTVQTQKSAELPDMNHQENRNPRFPMWKAGISVGDSQTKFWSYFATGGYSSFHAIFIFIFPY